MRQLSLSLVLASSLAFAQQEGPSAPPLVVAQTRTDSTPTGPATILVDDRVALLSRGMELSAGLLAGYSSPPILRVGIGYAWPSLSLMLTPAVLNIFRLARSSQQGESFALALELSARIYFWSRKTGTLTPYLSPQLSVSFAPGANGGNISAGMGIFGGAEYLITSRFGVTLDLGMNLFVLGIDSPAGGLISHFLLQGGVAVVLHQ